MPRPKTTESEEKAGVEAVIIDMRINEKAARLIGLTSRLNGRAQRHTARLVGGKPTVLVACASHFIPSRAAPTIVRAFHADAEHEPNSLKVGSGGT
jgi:hypothetical protein